MAVRRGKCTNFGNCSNADGSKFIDVPPGLDFVCPECGRQLNAMEERRAPANSRLLLLLLILVLVGGVSWYFAQRRPGGSGGSAAPVNSAVILRLHGSNTIGAQLGPALAQAYLRQLGAQDATIAPGAPDEYTVTGTVSGARQVIEIAAHGSVTAFSDLAAGKCDIGMASRKIKPDEAANLASFGDMTSPASEHVLGLDGVAVIVNPANPVGTLTTAQLAAVFAGETSDWSGLSGNGGPIRVYARDAKSGTYDTFKSWVLGNRQIVSSAARIEDSRQLAEKVAADAAGIGFVGLPYVNGAKTVAVSEKGARPLMPNRLTVATEDYPLSRRLYLYTPSNSPNPHVRRFVEFALSKQGQDIVGANGFVAQNVQTETFSAPAGSPSEYLRLTSQARRLSLNFRFRTGSSQLDNKALVDLDRVVSFISDLRYSGNDVMLFGFADSTGTDPVNDKLAKDRAQTVSEQFGQRGLKAGVVTGFGSHNPVASNDTDDGRQKNRRVEIWVKQKHGV